MTAAATDEATALRARLARAGVQVGAAASVLADLANDPPLGRSATVLAVEEPERVVAAVGAALVATGADRAVIAVRDVAAQQALSRVLDRVLAGMLDGATPSAVRVARTEPCWPTTGLDRDVGLPGALVLCADALMDLDAAAFERARARRRITVAGAITRPGVLAVEGAPTVEECVAAAGGATAPGDAWVAFDGGAYGGALAERDLAVRSSLLLVLPVTHGLVLKARTSLADHARRAASACEGCRACTDVCPVALDGAPLAPHALVAGTVLPAGERSGLRLDAQACTGCGLCDAACPGGLSPSALISSLRSGSRAPTEAPARGEAHPDRASRRMSIDLLVARAGLR